ncbi:MAG: hypothetical protein PUD68_02390, partial [Clostridiales bacterium]|nr:hypothetical protein [Clostridiales bacterium]
LPAEKKLRSASGSGMYSARAARFLSPAGSSLNGAMRAPTCSRQSHIDKIIIAQLIRFVKGAV